MLDLFGSKNQSAGVDWLCWSHRWSLGWFTLLQIPEHVKFHYHTDTGLCHRQASTQECELQATFLKLRNADTFSICKTFKAHNPRWYRSSAKLLSPGRMLSNFGGASVSPSTSFRMVSLSGSPIWIASDKPKASWTTASIGIWRAKWRPQSWTWLLVSKESKDNAGIASNLNFAMSLHQHAASRGLAASEFMAWVESFEP